ncbi:MAG: metallophosphoesterase family protein [Planctomycetaceae bacterium]
MPARTIAIGDVHGCDVALQMLLGRLALTADDTLVLLGDVVDRGPNSRRCVELLIDLRRRCEVVLVLGNHEEMMLRVLRGVGSPAFWLPFGGRETLSSYGGDPGDVPETHLEFLESGVAYHETATDIFVHAAIDPDVPLPQQSVAALRWQRFYGCEPPHVSGKRVVCGHTPQTSGRPAVWSGWVCLDTLAYGGGWLTALDATADAIWQSRQNGEVRGPLPLAVSPGQ